MTMDFMADAEFHPVFNRTSKRVNLQGCSTPEEINTRLKQKIYDIKQTYNVGPFGPIIAQRRVAPLRNLITGGFAIRCIDEATSQPKGIVALTLKYGREKALRIINRRKMIS